MDLFNYKDNSFPYLLANHHTIAQNYLPNPQIRNRPHKMTQRSKR